MDSRVLVVSQEFLAFPDSQEYLGFLALERLDFLVYLDSQVYLVTPAFQVILVFQVYPGFQVSPVIQVTLASPDFQVTLV